MYRTDEPPDGGPLQERIDALIDRLAEAGVGDASAEALPSEDAGTSLDDTRPQVPDQ